MGNIDADPAIHEVFAVKYAERDARRREHFLGGDPHDGPMPMDYFVWVAIGGGRTWVVDTGFAELDAEVRGRRLVRSTTDALATVGVDAARVSDVILTHLHYDHVGGLDQFPSAQFHVQDREVAYATGRHMGHPTLNHAFTADHIADLVRAVHSGRIVFHDGDDELGPGLSVHHLGGHTDGLQVVRVWTERGWLVLASDASHFYENMETGRPFPIVFDVGAMLAGYTKMRRLASTADAIVPGHDPLVLTRYPSADAGLDGVAVRLDRGWR
jgi:glyoxylase-like metal-dependent hydrolase (beta-lactamase superfamily II)